MLVVDSEALGVLKRDKKSAFFEGKLRFPTRVGEWHSRCLTSIREMPKLDRMKSSNPFIPSLVPAANPSRVRTTIIVTLAGQAVLMAVLLIQGCKPSAQAATINNYDVTSFTRATNTNTLSFEPLTTNPPSVSTNLAITPNLPAVDVAASNATVALLMPPLETNVQTPGAAAASGTYVVVSGDSFFKIAKSNHVTVRALKAANPDVDSHKLKVGQALNLPDGAEASASVASDTSSKTTTEPADAAAVSAPATTGTSLVYVVKSGDTLFRIAKAQHVSVKSLRALNNLATDKIVLGQKLKLTTSAAGSQS